MVLCNDSPSLAENQYTASVPGCFLTLSPGTKKDMRFFGMVRCKKRILFVPLRTLPPKHQEMSYRYKK